MPPSVEPIQQITIFGELHVIKFGFRAFNELGVNPFDPASVKAFEDEPKSARDLAKQLWAGMLHEYYGRNAPRKGQPVPSIDDVMDELDPFNYVEMVAALSRVKGSEQEAEKPADPPTA